MDPELAEGYIDLFESAVVCFRLAPVSSEKIFILIILFDTSTKVEPK